MTVASLANMILVLIIASLALLLIVFGLGIWNHNRLTRHAREGAPTLGTESVGAKLLEEIKSVSFNRGQVVDIRSFWASEDGADLPRYLRYVVVEDLIAARLIWAAPSDEEGMLPTIKAFVNYAFCLPPNRVRLTDMTWERMIRSGASGLAPSVVETKVRGSSTHRIGASAGFDGTTINQAALIDSVSALANAAPSLADALKRIADFVQRSEKADAIDLFNGFVEELGGAQPRKARLWLFWKGVVDALPEIASLSESVARIESLLDQDLRL